MNLGHAIEAKPNIEVDINIAGERLTRIKVTTYLGMTINENLTWDEHVRNIYGRVIAQ